MKKRLKDLSGLINTSVNQASAKVNTRVVIEPPAEVDYLWVCPFRQFHLVINTHTVSSSDSILRLVLNKDNEIIVLTEAGVSFPFRAVWQVCNSMDEALSYIREGRQSLDYKKELLLPYVHGISTARMQEIEMARLEAEQAVQAYWKLLEFYKVEVKCIQVPSDGMIEYRVPGVPVFTNHNDPC